MTHYINSHKPTLIFPIRWNISLFPPSLHRALLQDLAGSDCRGMLPGKGPAAPAWPSVVQSEWVLGNESIAGFNAGIMTTACPGWPPPLPFPWRRKDPRQPPKGKLEGWEPENRVGGCLLKETSRAPALPQNGRCRSSPRARGPSLGSGGSGTRGAVRESPGWGSCGSGSSWHMCRGLQPDPALQKAPKPPLSGRWSCSAPSFRPHLPPPNPKLEKVISPQLQLNLCSAAPFSEEIYIKTGVKSFSGDGMGREQLSNGNTSTPPRLTPFHHIRTLRGQNKFSSEEDAGV